MAPALEATVSWSGEPGTQRAVKAVPVVLGGGAEGVGRPCERGMSPPPGQSCQARDSLFAYYFAFICMPLSGRDPHFSAIASQFPGSLFSLNTPFSSKVVVGEGLSRTAGGPRRDQEVANQRLCLHSNSLILLLFAVQPHTPPPHRTSYLDHLELAPPPPPPPPPRFHEAMLSLTSRPLHVAFFLPGAGPQFCLEK